MNTGAESRLPAIACSPVESSVYLLTNHRRSLSGSFQPGATRMLDLEKHQTPMSLVLPLCLGAPGD